MEKIEYSWPLPECRINEMAALFNMKVARHITIPEGKYAPIGLMTLDIGTELFKDISLAGYKVINHAYSDYARHAIFNKFGSGHGSLFNKELYNYEEKMAKDMLVNKSF